MKAFTPLPAQDSIEGLSPFVFRSTALANPSVVGVAWGSAVAPPYALLRKAKHRGTMPAPACAHAAESQKAAAFIPEATLAGF